MESHLSRDVVVCYCAHVAAHLCRTAGFDHDAVNLLTSIANRTTAVDADTTSQVDSLCAETYTWVWSGDGHQQTPELWSAAVAVRGLGTMLDISPGWPWWPDSELDEVLAALKPSTGQHITVPFHPDLLPGISTPFAWHVMHVLLSDGRPFLNSYENARLLDS